VDKEIAVGMIIDNSSFSKKKRDSRFSDILVLQK